MAAVGAAVGGTEQHAGDLSLFVEDRTARIAAAGRYVDFDHLEREVAAEWNPSGKVTETWPVASRTTCQLVITSPCFSFTPTSVPEPYETASPSGAATRTIAGCGFFFDACGSSAQTDAPGADSSAIAKNNVEIPGNRTE